MSRWLTLLAVLIAACTQPVASNQIATKTTPPAEATPTPIASPTATPSYPPPVVDLPLTTLDFSCRLPIYKTDALTVDSFITFPSRDVTVDPNGNQGRYYDRAYSRWLPVARNGVSPDGSHYAFIESTQSDFVLYVVAVGSGTEVRFLLPANVFEGQPILLDYSNEGIYLINAFEHLLAGLWVFDLSTHVVSQVSSMIYPALSAGNWIIWTQTVNHADPNPVVTGTSAGTLPDEIDKVDIRSGQVTEWLYLPGEGLGVLGLDSRGLPLITVTKWGIDPTARLLLVAQPDSPTTIYKGVLVEGLGGGVTNAHGTWFGGQFGIYLYTNSGFLEKVSDHPGYPANGCF